jgi:hypothetical protein
VGKHVRVKGKFVSGNTLEAESIEELTITEATTVKVKLGETKFINGVKITLNKIVEDSRCPSGVQCVWAGRVVANVTLKSETDTETIEMTMGQNVYIETYTVKIDDVTPNKRSTKDIPPQDYTFTFRVSATN